MPHPSIQLLSIGAEEEPVVVLDNFAPDPDALRTAACTAGFTAAAQHYPGIRAELPAYYWAAQQPVIAAMLAQAFGGSASPTLIDASFSMVTRTADALTLRQRLPHCDAYAANRIALVHYLVPGDTAGTAFFRHRATGFETISEERAPHYREVLDREMRTTPRIAGYAVSDTPLFERTMLIDGRCNRAVLYRSALLHSGAITPDVSLSPDPARGRLTVTAFLSID